MQSVISSAKSVCMKRHIIIKRIIVTRKAAFNTMLLTVCQCVLTCFVIREEAVM